jgi:hypothetical protein
MKPLDMPFQQVLPTYNNTASRDSASIMFSLFMGVVTLDVSAKIFALIKAPSTSKNWARMCMLITLNMDSNGENLAIEPNVEMLRPYLAPVDVRNFL